MPSISYDSRLMRVPRSQSATVRSQLKKAFLRIEQLRTTKEQGFMDLPYDLASARSLNRLAKRLSKTYRNLIVVGIGGSDLGARAVYSALGTQPGGMRLRFTGANTDPDALYRFLQATDVKKSALCVISKSGGTLEPMATFLTLREAFKKQSGATAHRKQIFAITDPKSSTLRTIAEQEGYAVIPHPQNVGGRFSVLSTVGLFPSACAGIDISGMLAGARTQVADFEKNGARSMSAEFAVLHAIHYQKFHRNIHVLMPYADALRDVGFWFRQIWAESLGKVSHGKHVGPTPVAALGATDQHSQIQLYNQGPDDKVVTFIEIDKFEHPMIAPLSFPNLPGVAYFGKKTFEQMIHAERKGTADALAANGRPNGTIHLSRLTPETLGALFQCFEQATAVMGELMHVNTFDQPGVEEGKKRAERYLARS